MLSLRRERLPAYGTDHDDDVVGGPDLFLGLFDDALRAEPAPPQAFEESSRSVERDGLGHNYRRTGWDENVITRDKQVLGMGHAPNFK
jgi:hypothetical protein